MTPSKKKILTLFGTRPEIIKLAPIIHELEEREGSFETINVSSTQHTDLLYPFVRLFGVKIDYDLKVMQSDQTPNKVCSRVLSAIEPILENESPDLLLVQGDTTTAMSGTLAAFHQGIPVGHVEAGLRTGNPLSPFPEEMNRRLITRVATYHFAATRQNRDTLISEGTPQDKIFVTGNPVVDSLKSILNHKSIPSVKQKLKGLKTSKLIVLTTHRRESFEREMAGNLRVLRRFIEKHEEIALAFPVHPNPAVREHADAILSGHPRILLLEPLDYTDFIGLLSCAWLIVSDSGGVQEEAPTLGKPLLILRENTERPEAIESGVARLVGGDPNQLAVMLEEVYQDGIWIDKVKNIQNPFGNGTSGAQIVDIIANLFRIPTSK